MSFKGPVNSSTPGNMKYCGPSTTSEEKAGCYLNQRATKVPGGLLAETHRATGLRLRAIALARLSPLAMTPSLFDAGSVRTYLVSEFNLLARGLPTEHTIDEAHQRMRAS